MQNNIGALRLAMVTLSLFNLMVRFGYFKSNASSLIANEYLAIMAALFVAAMLEVLLWAFLPDFTDSVLQWGNGKAVTNTVNVLSFVAVCAIYAYTDFVGCDVAAFNSITKHETQGTDVAGSSATLIAQANERATANNAAANESIERLEKSRASALRKSPKDANWINSKYDKQIQGIRNKVNATNERTLATASASAQKMTASLTGLEALKLKRDMQLNGHELSQAENKSGMWRFLTIGCALLLVAAGLTKRRTEIELNITPKQNKAFELLADAVHSALTGFAHLVAYLFNLIGQAQRIEQPRLQMKATRGGINPETADEIAKINQRIATNMTRKRDGADVQHLIDRDREILAKLKGL